MKLGSCQVTAVDIPNGLDYIKDVLADISGCELSKQIIADKILSYLNFNKFTGDLTELAEQLIYYLFFGNVLSAVIGKTIRESRDWFYKLYYQPIKNALQSVLSVFLPYLNNMSYQSTLENKVLFRTLELDIGNG